MKREHYVDEPTIATRPQVMTGLDNSIADAVANGRLFVLNGRGEMELVAFYSYWRDGNIYSVVAPGTGPTGDGGYEFDENGDVTRDWRQS